MYYMEFSPVSLEILQRVEEVTGAPVEVIFDGTLQVLAKIRMARSGQPSHLLRVQLNRPTPPDYFIAYECGFILRLYENPPGERFEFGASEAGRAEVLRLLKIPGGLAQKLRLPDPALVQHAGMLCGGLGTQLCSIPIGMRIDRWIYDTYPSLRQAQSSAINEQQRNNMQVLSPQIRAMSPTKVYTASVSMNAAYALFCDELYGEGGYSVAYRTAGFATQGAQLLERWREILPAPAHDRQLVDAWAGALGLATWYQWVPLPAASGKP